MDVLEKLQEKNKQQAHYRQAHIWHVFIVFIMMSPLLFSYGYGFYYEFYGQEVDLMHPGIVMIGTLAFGLPLSGMGSLLLFSKPIKAILLIISTVWFTYFWVVLNIYWVAFVPWVPAYMTLRFQMPEIKKKLMGN